MLRWFFLALIFAQTLGEIRQFLLYKNYDRVAHLVSTGKWVKTLQLAKQSGTEGLVDYYDDFYNINVSIGTPPQIISLAFATGSSATWVIDAACYSDYCVGWTISDYDKNQFFTFNTTTFVNTTRKFSLKYTNGDEASGFVGSDVFSVAGFTIQKQEFGVAESVNRAVGLSPIDGYFGVGFPAYETSNMQPPIFALASQMDQPVFTVWLDRHKAMSYGATGGQVTLGGLDDTNCNATSWNWHPITVNSNWEYEVDGFAIGKYSITETVNAVSSTGKSFIGFPQKVLAFIERATNAQYNFEYQVYTVHCNVQGLPDFVFTIKGVQYHVPQEQYVIDISLNNGMCALAVTPSSDNTWVLGDAFIRSYCQAYDMGNNRVGFAQALHSSD